METINHSDTMTGHVIEPMRQYAQESTVQSPSQFVTGLDSTSLRPVVIPQTCNLFNIKSLSPFPTSVYCPQLQRQQISEAELEQCIREVNAVLMSSPAFQLAFLTGGFLMGAQGVLPVQAVGGGVQIMSAALSAGISWYRTKKYIRDVNASRFGPKGLRFGIVTTSEMIKIVGYTTETPPESSSRPRLLGKGSGKPELALPDLSSLDEDENDPSGSNHATELGDHVYRRRLEALSDYVAPLIIKEEDAAAEDGTNSKTTEPKNFTGILQKVSTKPLRWINERDVKKMVKARSKWQQEADPTKKSKKLKKIDRKEHKVANRLLWIVITPLEENGADHGNEENRQI